MCFFRFYSNMLVSSCLLRNLNKYGNRIFRDGLTSLSTKRSTIKDTHFGYVFTQTWKYSNTSESFSASEHWKKCLASNLNGVVYSTQSLLSSYGTWKGFGHINEIGLCWFLYIHSEKVGFVQDLPSGEEPSWFHTEFLSRKQYRHQRTECILGSLALCENLNIFSWIGFV